MAVDAGLLACRDQLVAWRRDIHAHPELGFREVRTSGIVAAALAGFGLEVLKDFCPARTAVVGVLRTGRPGRTVAIRADMDALPMQDEKDVPYRSQNPGVCHACGHDGHTATLLAVAQYCAAHPEEFTGTLKFVFQPAEEGPAPGGAKYIMESGVLDDVDYMIAGHQSTYTSVGQIVVRPGVVCASGDSFSVELSGPGTHAVSPQDGADVIVAAVQIIDSWQSMMTRRVDPQQAAVLSVCSLHAGEPGARNVLPSSAVFSGTLRTFREDLRARLHTEMRRRAEQIAAFCGCSCRVEIEPHFPVLYSDPAVTALLQEQAARVVGADAVFVAPEPSMGSEDFAYYAQKIPSSYFMYGVRNEAKGIVYGGHHPRFDLDEDALLVAMDVFLHAAKALARLPAPEKSAGAD